jgi:hypothetical protein
MCTVELNCISQGKMLVNPLFLFGGICKGEKNHIV